LINSFSWSQDQQEAEKCAEYQKKWFNEAKANVKKGDLIRGFIFYRWAYSYDTLSIKGKLSLHKSDSLKVFLRNKLKNDIQGNWILKQNKSNCKNDNTVEKGEILIVSNDQLKFYNLKKNSRRGKIIQQEHLNFTKNIDNMFPSYMDLIFSNNQIWKVIFDKKKGELVLKNSNALNDAQADKNCATKKEYTKID
jgi:predicted small secreted protein